jgi:hypothetical protein
MYAEANIVATHMSVHQANGERVSRNWNAVFRVLSQEPRRQLIVSLLDVEPGEAVQLPEGAVMPNVPPDPQQLRVELQHRHLPMLADHGFVTWESGPLRASRGPRFEEVAVVFEALHAEATTLPETLVTGCRRLEEERQQQLE